MTYWMFWLILGVALCFSEIIFPTAFIEFAMGLSALLVSLLSLSIDNFLVQATIWLCLSTAIAIATRKLVPRRRVQTLEDSAEAETLSPIPAGQKGRVLYESNSWYAYCDNPAQALPARLKVEVVRREGNTLVVRPTPDWVSSAEVSAEVGLDSPTANPLEHPPEPSA
jgi:membrane protein implicated in regulation of membrane protease activity